MLNHICCETIFLYVGDSSYPGNKIGMFKKRSAHPIDLKQSATLPSSPSYFDISPPPTPSRLSSPKHHASTKHLKTSLELLSDKQRVSRIVRELKNQFVQFGRFSRKESWQSPPTFPVEQRGPSRSRTNSSSKLIETLSQLQQKISSYTAQHSLKNVRSEQKLLMRARSAKKEHLTEKVQQCKKLCLQMKKKLLKETVSTNASREERRAGVKLGDFEMGRVVGQGKFSKVHLARHIKSGTIFALKVIKKSTIRQQKFEEQLSREIKIQLYFSEVNIVRLYTVFSDANCIYLLLQYCVDGQLYDILSHESSISEKRWAPIMSGICDGLFLLHQHHVIHRDLKPQNVMLSFGLAKLADMGWSVHSPTQPRDTFCGTPLYISPQILLGGSYGQEVDVWALGVMMYEFLTGTLPFPIQKATSLAVIVNSRVKYPPSLSCDAVDLLRQILEKNPHVRITIGDILQHPFLKKQASLVRLPI